MKNFVFQCWLAKSANLSIDQRERALPVIQDPYSQHIVSILENN